MAILYQQFGYKLDYWIPRQSGYSDYNWDLEFESYLPTLDWTKQRNSLCLTNLAIIGDIVGTTKGLSLVI